MSPGVRITICRPECVSALKAIGCLTMLSVEPTGRLRDSSGRKPTQTTGLRPDFTIASPAGTLCDSRTVHSRQKQHEPPSATSRPAHPDPGDRGTSAFSAPRFGVLYQKPHSVSNPQPDDSVGGMRRCRIRLAQGPCSRVRDTL